MWYPQSRLTKLTTSQKTLSKLIEGKNTLKIPWGGGNMAKVLSMVYQLRYQ